VTFEQSAKRLCGVSRRGGVALLSLVTVVVTCVLAHEGHTPLPTKGIQFDMEKGLIVLSPEARKALDVRTADVMSQPVEEKLLAYVTLAAPWQRHAFASSLLPGRIVELMARPGQVVRAGQPLATVESFELESLQLELLNAQTEVELSAKVLEQVEPSVRSGAVPERVLVEAQSKHRQNTNRLDVAKSKWSSLGLSAAELSSLLIRGRPAIVKTLPVRSLVEGTVIHADVSIGKIVEAGEHLFEVVDLAAVWGQIGVLEKDMYRVGPGQRVELTFSAYPQEVFPATVQIVGGAIDPRTHLNTVWVELANPDRLHPRLMPGMTGQAEFIVDSRPAARTLPTTAVHGDGVVRYVLVEEASANNSLQLIRRNVVVGRESENRVEIVGGDLFPGDRVVTQGGHELAAYFVPGVLRLSPEASRNIGLKIEPLQHRMIDSVLEVNGAVDLPPDKRAIASSRLSGTLSTILVDRGQAVRAGQLIAKIVSLELQDQQLELIKAHLEAQLLEETVTRLKTSAAISARQILEVESQLAAARNRRESLRRNLLAVGLTSDVIDRIPTDREFRIALPILAPCDGFVVQFDKVLGQSIKAGEPLFAIHDISKAMIQGFVSERDLAHVRIDQKARVRLVADPTSVIEGRVVRSSRVFEIDSRTLSVWIEPTSIVARPLRHGQLATITLVRASSESLLAVPHSAIVAEGTRSFVFVRNADGILERKPIQPGREDDRYVEIIEGIQKGDMVAVTGATQLQTAFAGLR
jgi:RND family efflux transporter MFP subunit